MQARWFALRSGSLPLLASLALLGCGRSAPQRVGHPAAPILLGPRIPGRVVSTNGGRGLDEAMVELQGTSIQVRTDSVGAFILPGVPSGRYTVLTRRMGYYPGRGVLVVPLGSGHRIEIGIDPIYGCMDYCARPQPTPGFLHVLP